MEEVLVTGSRVANNGNQAPTPVTVLSSDKLLETTPTTVVDALKSLPAFLTEPATRNTAGNATANPVGNYLDLRYFGANRTLVLQDGQRLPPTSANGAVDTNLIPQSLVSRVDIVTGGASAVYGSDAVTGVVNFILDHDYTGLEFNAQSGIATYGDDVHWKVGGKYGTPILDGRAHFLLSVEHFDSKGIEELDDRPESRGAWATGGDGTAENPYQLIKNGRTAFNGFGGMIIGPPEIGELIFKENGVPSPFVHGLPTGVSVLEQGGDYGTNYGINLIAPLKRDQVYSRVDLDVTDTVKSHLQFSYNGSSSYIDYIPLMIGFFPPVAIFSGNPFIPPSIQQTMTDNNVPYIEMMRTNQFGDGYPTWATDTHARNIYANLGFEGNVFNDFQWKVDYAYSESLEHVVNPHNINAAKQAAALDAVRDPSTGEIVCAVSLTAGAANFPGCQPLNLFGPTAPSLSAFDYITDPTGYKLRHVFNDVSFSLAGSPFSLWAGPVSVAVAGEYRTLEMRNTISNGDARKTAECDGLAPSPNCGPQWLQYISETTGPAHASEHVKEISGELLIPLVRDVPMIRALDLNLAGRVTHYQTSGTVETWKIGGTWQATDDLRFRGAVSQDIRAPTLLNLAGPTIQTAGQVTDIHTGVTLLANLSSEANPDLVPEKARTHTVGFVYQPAFIPRLSLAVDFYKININNAIVTVTGADVLLQQECEASNGASPFCDLLVRPLPFSDRTEANAPMLVKTGPLNAARQWTKGIDIEVNYDFDALGGLFAARALVAYQPEARTQTVASVPYLELAGVAVAGAALGNASGNAGNGFSKLRTNLNVAYTRNDFSATLVERIQSGMDVTDSRLFVDTRSDIPTYAYTDISMSYRFGGFKPFLAVQNLFNKRPPIVGSASIQPHGTFPTPIGYDVVGRYFTLGVRATF